MSKNLAIAQLLDIYGSMLTDKQRDVMELYYFEDFSLSEIAQYENITRQGVRDSIKRAESVLCSLEDKLGIASKFSDILRNVSAISAEVRSISEISSDECVLKHARNIRLVTDVIENIV